MTPTPRTDSPADPPPPARALGLDALRGLAILLMCLSGVVPDKLPNAMYHGYYPRFLPDGDGAWQPVENPWQFRGDWPSLTWVDWVFPVFLFAMGAAIPLAMANRRERGVGLGRLALGVVWRWLVLIGFAVYVRQIDPYVIDPQPGTRDWLLAILGFTLLIPALARLPRGWSKRTRWLTRLSGVVGCVTLVTLLNRGPDKSFAWSQNDIIILLLAHAALVGGLAWVVLPRWPILRALLLLPICFVAHHQAMSPDWRLLADRIEPIGHALHSAERWLDWTAVSAWFNGRIPDAWLDLSPLWDYTWLKFMWVVVSGMLIGEVLVRRAKPDPAADDTPRVVRWGVSRLLLIALLLTAAITAVFVGAKDHGQTLFTIAGFELLTPYAALMLAGPILALGSLCLLGARDRDDRLLVTLVAWGIALLVVGLLLNAVPHVGASASGQPFTLRLDRTQAFEGGIKKGPPATLSYYLTAAGLSVLALAVFNVLVDRLRFGRWLLSLLIVNGQNPMLAYAGIRSLLLPLMKLPLLAPFGLAGVTTLDQFGFQDLPKRIAAWRGQAALATEPWVLFGWSVAKTLLLGAFVWVMTKLRVVLRS